MRLLSIETTSRVTGVALIEDGEVRAELSWRGDGDSAGRLLAAVDTVLGTCTPEDVDRFVVSVGPGSWTGIRIGISLAKGLALGRTGRLYALDTMSVLAHPLRGLPLRPWCLVPARRDLFWLARAPGPGSGRQPRARQLDVAGALKTAGKHAVFTGPGLAEIPGNERRDIPTVSPALWMPRASWSGLAACERMARGTPSLPAEPWYGTASKPPLPRLRI